MEDGLERLVTAAARRPRAFLSAAAACSFLLLASIAAFIFQKFPNSADEYNYVFFADTLRAGRLWNPVPPLSDFFFHWHIIIRDGKWMSRFPPGWPCLLAAADILKIPGWLLNPILGVLLLVTVYFLARREHGEKTAVAAVMVCAVSPFFLFNSASFFSHSFCALLVALFWLACSRLKEKDSAGLALAAGGVIGAAFVTRYYTALLCAIPPAVLLLRAKRARGVVDLLWIGLGAAPFVAALLAYNKVITGDALHMVTTWYDPTEKLGFQADYGPLTAMIDAGHYAKEFVLWTPVTLAPLFAAGLFRAFRRGRLTEIDLAFPVLGLGYMLWSKDAGNRYGPRFHYEAYPLLIVSVCSWLFDANRAVLDSREKRHARIALTLGLAACLPAAVVWGRYEYRVVYERREVYRLAAERGLANAVIFITSSSGGLLPMPPGDLTRNGITADGSVLFVADLGARNRELKAAYPGRTFYTYYHRPGAEQGSLSERRF